MSRRALNELEKEMGDAFVDVIERYCDRASTLEVVNALLAVVASISWTAPDAALSAVLSGHLALVRATQAAPKEGT